MNNSERLRALEKRVKELEARAATAPTVFTHYHYHSQNVLGGITPWLPPFTYGPASSVGSTPNPKVEP